MSPRWLLENLAAYSVQMALVMVAAELAASVLRLQQPRIMLKYWQTVLAACLLLPLIEPWQPMGIAPLSGATTFTGPSVGGAGSRLDRIPFHLWVLLVLVAGVAVGLVRLALGL